VAPLARDSGKRKGTRAIFGGRGQVRAALYMVAIVACMRKILIILNAMVRTQSRWNEHLVISY